jgi:hypothetical protein
MRLRRERRITGQARDFKPHNDAGFAERHFADQLLKAVTGGGAGAGLAEVSIDDVNATARRWRKAAALRREAWGGSAVTP